MGMTDDPERKGGMADNQALINALVGPTELREYRPRQATESWQEFLARSAPGALSTFLMGLSAIPAFRGPIMRGPAQGLTPQDFVIANRLAGSSGRSAYGHEATQAIKESPVMEPARQQGRVDPEVLLDEWNPYGRLNSNNGTWTHDALYGSDNPLHPSPPLLRVIPGRKTD